jgi:uncharacterized cupin superfamily protein
VLEGTPTLVLDQEAFTLNPGDCCAFKAGTGIAHQILNRSGKTVTYLEVGDRTVGDEVAYPNADLKATQLPNGQWVLTHKDGRSYQEPA